MLPLPKLLLARVKNYLKDTLILSTTTHVES